MLEPWNDSSILPPPVNMFLCVKKVDLSVLKHVCNNIYKVLAKQSPLHKESALCSRFLYKYDRKFRNDIGYRNFRKVHTALKKYLTLNLIKDIENFLSALPSENDDEKYLPTKQMLEYVMLRIITFCMIMLRICVCSKQAAIFYLNRIRRGESHWMSLLPYALLSRLWSMTMVLVQHGSTWYSSLYPYLSKLELKGLPFLPDNYQLPENLEELLDLKNIDCFGRFDWDQSKLIEIDHSLLDDNEENDLFDNILSYVNDSNKIDSVEELDAELKPILNKYNEEISLTTSLLKTDHGEVLSRDAFKKTQEGGISRQSVNMDQGEVLSRESFKRDQGEALSRDSFKVLLNSSGKVTKSNNASSQNANKIVEEKGSSVEKIETKNIVKEDLNEHSHMKVTNAASLRAFLDKEETFRNESDNRSLTNHLSLMQWHALKNALLKLCEALANRKIDKKIQKIWKQKCLDYK